jgi:hypothetical protein
MTEVFKFRYSTTDVDLFGGGDIDAERWVAKVTTRGEDVEEIITVLVDDTSDDNLATELQTLDDLILRVDRYRENPTYYTPVWLHAKRDGETGERRALVKQLSYTLLAGDFDPEANEYRIPLTLSVVRGGYWERTSARSLPDESSSAKTVVSYDYTAAGIGVSAHDIVGDVPARPLAFSLTTDSGAEIDRVWCGIRSAGVRQITNYENTWECEDGTNEAIASDNTTSETYLASPGGGSGAYVDATPAADNTWEMCLTLQLGDVYASDADYDAAFGTFLWLLRAKVDASTTMQVQLRFGYNAMDDADFVRGNIIEFTNTSWNIVAMDTETVPSRDLHALNTTTTPTTYEGTWAIQIWAKRTSGSGGVLLDCLFPIAVDEGYLIASDMELNGAITGVFMYGEAPEGKRGAITYTNGELSQFATLDVENFRLPPGDGRIDIVMARQATSVFTDYLYVNLLDLSSAYAERWRSLRGGE